MLSIIVLAAKVAKVSPELLLAICMHESGLKNVEVPHDGGSPTYGICQVKLGTAQMIGYKGTGKGLMNPTENAKWAAEYLKWQMERYNGNYCKAVSAYNAGTYNESDITPGKPRNLRYVRNVQAKLKYHLQPKLSCDNNSEIAKLGE